MPRYLLRGLIIAFLAIAALIGASVGISYFTSANLNKDVVTARAQGFTQGYSKGVEEGLNKGNEAGYQAGSKLALLAAGVKDVSVNQTGYYFMYNPTYTEIMSTLRSSQMNSSQQILDYSRANGIRAAYVRVPIARVATEGRVYLYQLVAFETVDKGLIIVEPASHREVKVEVGKSYAALNGFPPSNFDDTITKVTIVW